MIDLTFLLNTTIEIDRSLFKTLVSRKNLIGMQWNLKEIR